ncbi:enoyl-CoA hydratase [Kordiimonas sediminis]|uniref:Enoyl-CoA hydratase n=1 Tax=Kordiimonas sediminis TaxID=1735581 RepID=A0A919AU36_9PROT|nr:enoyl-CoA hydratase-related protein [Kordiimonas sediminis]GHF23519.1 enoyl-CoA hydratase [Kordiimonas sediminis]
MDYSDRSHSVYIEKADGIGRLVLNRPDKFNAMSYAMWRAIPEAAKLLDTDPDVRVIVVCSSSDKAFSAGADIKELEEFSQDEVKREKNRVAIRQAQRILARTEKPTIAEVPGACIGGGCGLAIHCDMRIASSQATFGITPARLGIVYPLNDTRQLIELVGPSAAKHILFTGRIFAAEEALQIGLVDQVVEPDLLPDTVRDLASNMASVSQYSVRGIKKVIRRILDGQLDDDAETAKIFTDAHNGMDAREGVAAFREKRPPNFRWNG